MASDPTELCEECGLERDDCDCDEFVPEDDDDQYAKDLPRAVDLLVEDDDLTVRPRKPRRPAKVTDYHLSGEAYYPSGSDGY